MIKTLITHLKQYRKVIYLFIAGSCSSLFQWITISVMTKIFSLETVGIYSGAVAVITPIVTFANLSFLSMQVTDIKDQFRIVDVYYVKKITSIIATIIILIFFLFKGYRGGTLIFASIILSSKIAYMFSDSAHGKYIRENQTVKYTISVLLTYSLSTLFFSTAAIISKNIYLSIALYAIPFFGVFVLYNARNTGGIRACFQRCNSKEKYVSMIRLCLPLAIVQTINTLYDSIPKLLIEDSLGASQLGIFSATSYISLAGGLVVTAITTAYATELSQMIKQRNKRGYTVTIITEMLIIAGLCAALITVLSIWGKSIITFLYTSEYSHNIDVVILLVVAMSLNFLSRVMGTACTAARLNQQQLNTAAICILFLLVVSWLYIPQYGMTAAVIIMCITYLLKLSILSVIFITKMKSLEAI